MKKHSLYSIILIFLSSPLLSQNTDNKNISTWQEDISIAAIEELQNSGTPSLQIAIGFKDSIIFNKVYGIADLENNVPAKIETKYRTASVSKW